MRILFVLPRMVSGGVERVTLTLIREFVREGHVCALALRRSSGEFLDEARDLCDVIELAPRGMHEFVANLAQLMRDWEPTHVVTAFADVGALTWYALRKARISARWIHGVHNTHSPIAARNGIRGKMRFWMDRRFAGFVYKRADAIVAVSNGVRSEIIEEFKIDPVRVTTIYNPVIPEDQLRPISMPRHDPSEPYTIVALGRLVRQKGFDILVEAMAFVPQPWRLDIWGEGEDRPILEAMISQRGLQHSIRLRGYTKAPLTMLERADMFVLSSRHEGLPTVLIEALASQCQIVAVDCPHGPREILQEGRFGRLVETESQAALAEAVSAIKEGIGIIPPERMLVRAADFSAHVSVRKWISLLGELNIQAPKN